MLHAFDWNIHTAVVEAQKLHNAPVMHLLKKAFERGSYFDTAAPFEAVHGEATQEEAAQRQQCSGDTISHEQFAPRKLSNDRASCVAEALATAGDNMLSRPGREGRPLPFR